MYTYVLLCVYKGVTKSVLAIDQMSLLVFAYCVQQTKFNKSKIGLC